MLSLSNVDVIGECMRQIQTFVQDNQWVTEAVKVSDLARCLTRRNVNAVWFFSKALWCEQTRNLARATDTNFRTM